MKYEEAGTYELTYKAVDECGNEATRKRTIIVEESEKQYITLLDLSNYTAPNNTPMAKADGWDFDKGTNLVVEASGVFADGNVPVTVENVYWDGEIINPSIAIIFDGVEDVMEWGSGVWFFTDYTDATKFTSAISSEGQGELVPYTITFEKLVVKQEVEQ